MKESLLIAKNKIYIIDFFNIFSDFREIKYKKLNINFHNVKQHTKKQDTLDFFKLFFTKYIQYTNIYGSSVFIFVMKRLYEYEDTLLEILELYKNFNIQFVIIKTRYNDIMLDKNKDDFLCQYLFINYSKEHSKENFMPCNLISNDKYRDRLSYLNNYDNMEIILYNFNLQTNTVNKNEKIYNIDKKIINDMISKYQNYQRCSIPKNKLYNILK
jgi:hypothetical protein